MDFTTISYLIGLIGSLIGMFLIPAIIVIPVFGASIGYISQCYRNRKAVKAAKN